MERISAGSSQTWHNLGGGFVTLTVRVESMREITIQETDSGIQLCFLAECGDRFLVELSDAVIGPVIAQLVHYAWGITMEEAFPT